MQGMIMAPPPLLLLLPIEESTGKKRKYTENRLNNSSDQLYMQRTNNLTSKQTQTLLEEESGCAGAEEDIRFARGRRRRHKNVFTILLTCRCGGIHTWDSICMFRYRRPTWWLMSFENWTKKQARGWSRALVERESREREGKKERDEIREEEERQRARQRARERENRRARLLAMAFWRRSDDGLYTAEGPSSPAPPQPTLMLGFWKITT